MSNSIIDNWCFKSAIEKAKFSGIANVVNKANALGEDVIRLEVGDVDLNPPETILDGIVDAFAKNKTHYPPFKGDKLLIDKIIETFKKEEMLIDEKQILICPGGSMGMYLSMQALFQTGDEVLIFEPVWPHLVEMIVLADAIPVKVPLKAVNNFHIDIKELDSYITDKTKAVVLNSPNNPTGVIYTKKEIKELADFCGKNHLAIISDEEYEAFRYGDNEFFSSLRVHDATIVSRSFSKSLSVSGLRLGYLIGPPSWMERISKLSLFSTMYPSSIIQHAIAKEIENDTGFSDNMAARFEKRMTGFVNGLNEIEGVKCNFSEGAVYVWVDCRSVDADDFNIADRLLQKEKVAVVPGSCFGESGKGFLRISLGADESKLEEAIKRIQRELRKK